LEDYVVTGQFHSHLSPKLEARPLPEKGGWGVYAREPVRKGELLVLWGGRIIDESELDPTMPNFSQRVLQIEEGYFLLAPEPLEPSDRFNHSCNPNAGFSGQVGLVAMRDIAPGEEVCFDYAMCDGTPTTNSSAPVAQRTVVATSQAKTGSVRTCGNDMPDTICPIFNAASIC
jgi:SET domain-containing protein